jgi:hypothetical protein
LSGEKERLILAKGMEQETCCGTCEFFGVSPFTKDLVRIGIGLSIKDWCSENRFRTSEKGECSVYQKKKKKLSMNYQGKTYLRSDAAMPIQTKKRKEKYKEA